MDNEDPIVIDANETVFRKGLILTKLHEMKNKATSWFLDAKQKRNSIEIRIKGANYACEQSRYALAEAKHNYAVASDVLRSANIKLQTATFPDDGINYRRRAIIDQKHTLAALRLMDAEEEMAASERELKFIRLEERHVKDMYNDAKIYLVQCSISIADMKKTHMIPDNIHLMMDEVLAEFELAAEGLSVFANWETGEVFLNLGNSAE